MRKLREVHFVDVLRYGKTIRFRHKYVYPPKIFIRGKAIYKNKPICIFPLIVRLTKNSVKIACFHGEDRIVKGKAKVIIEGVGYGHK